jgi:hypothetical protein
MSLSYNEYKLIRKWRCGSNEDDLNIFLHLNQSKQFQYIYISTYKNNNNHTLTKKKIYYLYFYIMLIMKVIKNKENKDSISKRHDQWISNKKIGPIHIKRISEIIQIPFFIT